MKLAGINPAPYAWLVVLLIIAVLIFRYPVHTLLYPGALPGDFEVYLRAWQRVSSHLSPYVSTDPSPYKYSPGVLTLMGVLPRDPVWAWVVFSSASIVTFGIALIFGARYRSWRNIGLLICGLLLSWKGIIETLDYGQVELLIFAIGVGAAALLKPWPFLAGLLAGLLPWIKLPWFLFILPLGLATARLRTATATRQPKRLRLLVSGYVLALFIWGAMIPSLTFGSERAKELFQEWITLLRHQPAVLFESDLNQSVWASAIRWTGTSWMGYVLAIGLTALLLFSFTLTLIRRRRLRLIQAGVVAVPERPVAVEASEDEASVFGWVAPWLVLTQLLNPLSWRWGSVFVLGIPFAVWRNPTGHRRTRAVLIIFVTLLWLVQLNPVVKMLGYHHWSELHAGGLVTVYWIALLLLALV